jgi:hypothetical protein
MQALRDTPDAGLPDATPDGGRTRVLAAMLQTWSDTGYGLWTLQGLALAFGIFRHGRGESLVPLALGVLFVSVGWVVASLKRPGMPAWHGWYPGRSAWPPREALVALAVYLPLLAVAGLTRGDNEFWATRVAGAALMVCSLGMLSGSPGRQHPQPPSPPTGARSSSVGRVIGGLYGGGLWLWLCVAADRGGMGPADPAHQPWLLILLVMALVLGLLEGVRWHALRGPDTERTAAAGGSMAPARFFAALLTYAVPCTALLLADRWQASGLMALLAAVCAVAGRTLEQRFYAQALCCAPLPAAA